jgi:hypothetical protein
MTYVPSRTSAEDPISDDVVVIDKGSQYTKALPRTLLFGQEGEDATLGVTIPFLNRVRLTIKSPSRFKPQRLRFESGVLDALEIIALNIAGKAQPIFLPLERAGVARFLHDVPLAIDFAEPGDTIELIVHNRTGSTVRTPIALFGTTLE